MYARYFNHKQTENALLDRVAEQDVEGLNRIKWPDIVREIQITNNSMIQSYPNLCCWFQLTLNVYFKSGDSIGLKNQKSLLASTLFSAVSSLSLFNIGKGIR